MSTKQNKNILNQAKIIITKPDNQATYLCEQIHNAGGIPIHFPTIKIEDVLDKESVSKIISNLTKIDIIIFISPTAVQKAIPLIKEHFTHPHPSLRDTFSHEREKENTVATHDQLIKSGIEEKIELPEHLQIIAVGSGTAVELIKLGIMDVTYPDENFGTEGLLSLLLLHNVQEKNIMIIKGVGGRELLANTLTKRGAHISELAVYQRALPKISSEEIVAQWQEQGIDLIICTSENSLQNLITLIGASANSWLKQQLLLVSSARLIQIASSFGFIHTPVLAKNASDEAILSAIMNWRGKQHG